MSLHHPSGVEFVLLVEQGLLEEQGLLACESLRAFGGVLASSPVSVVSPRASRRPSREGLARFEAMGAEYLPLDIDNPTPEAGESYKPLALAIMEGRAGPETLIQLDSDTLFVAEPRHLMVEGQAAARPVDAPNLCTSGPASPLDPYWQDLCRLTGVVYDHLPVVETTVGDVPVKANYNGGLIAAKRGLGLFKLTADIYRTIVDADLRLPGGEGRRIMTGAGMVTGAAARYFGLSQIAFALACGKTGAVVDLLPPGYNFPVNMLHAYAKAVPSPLVHIHYHALASTSASAEEWLLGDRLALPDDVKAWLASRLPLRSPPCP